MRQVRLTSTDSSIWIKGTAASLWAGRTGSIRICRDECALMLVMHVIRAGPEVPHSATGRRAVAAAGWSTSRVGLPEHLAGAPR